MQEVGGRGYGGPCAELGERVANSSLSLEGRLLEGCVVCAKKIDEIIPVLFREELNSVACSV